MSEVIQIDSPKFPQLLKEIPDSPKNLYYKGNLRQEIFNNCVAVIGSRRMSPYGSKVVDHILSGLSKSITIVSGFMYGVDAEAHRKSLELGLPTIAVMPCGIDFIHPSDQKELYEKIIYSGGLIVSEYRDKLEPRVWTYSKRNRIVAGLSKVVLVVEAALGSGSLITADLANKYQRKVLAVPGNIFSDVSKGCTQLLQSFARPVSSGFEINDLFGFRQPILIDENRGEDQTDEILELLKSGSMSLDELCAALETTVSHMSAIVTLLSINGKIFEDRGKYYAR